MGRLTLKVVRDGSGDPPKFWGWSGTLPGVGGPVPWSGTGQWILGKVRDGSGDPREVKDGSGDPRGGLVRDVGPFWMSGRGWETLAEIRDGSVDPRGGLVRVVGPSPRSRMARGTIG